MTDFITITGFQGIAMEQAFEQGAKAEPDATNPYATEMDMGNGPYCPTAIQRGAWNFGLVDDKDGMRRFCDTLNAEAEAEEQERLSDKGHDCYDHVVHGHDGQRDYYECGKCGELLQVG